MSTVDPVLQGNERISLTELVHLFALADQIPHFLPEGEVENSPGWSVAQSWESVPT
jgi:hypothetical protein